MINKNVGKGLLLSTAALASVSCANAPVQEKPNIDRLAEEGIL